MIPLEQILSFDCVHRLGWTLLHSLWQLALAGVLLFLLLRLLRHRVAATRYLVACAGLLGMLMALPVTYFFLSAAASPESTLLPASLANTADLPRISSPPVEPLAEPSKVPEQHLISTSPPDSQVSHSVSSTPPIAALEIPSSSLLDRAARLFAPYVPWIAPLWALGVVGLSLWHLGGYLAVRRLGHSGVTPVPEPLAARFRELQARLKVRQPVRLLQSILVEVPVAIGWLRPVILVPAAVLAGLTPGELDAVLAHELAHVRRYDYLVNLLQTVVETLLFYHPAAWWVSRRIRIEREHCCDDVAVAICGSKVEYAEALTAIEKGRRASELVMAATGTRRAGTTLGRIRRILGVSSPDCGRASLWLGGIITLALLALLAVVLPLGHAQEEQESTSPWGDAVEGVSVRLRADRPRWSPHEAPTFTLDFRNQGSRNLKILQAPVTGTFEVDGTRHAWLLGWNGGASSPFPPGQTYEGLVIGFSEGWQGKLTPGKHTIRYVTYPLQDANASTEKTVKPKVAVPGSPLVKCTSNPVEIEIVASAEAPRPVAVPWGSPVEGTAVQLRADHFAWTADDRATFAASVRNQGRRNLFVAETQEPGELEVDGIWYYWVGTTRAKNASFGPGQHHDGIPVTLTVDWRTKDGQPFNLTPGRHLVRFAAKMYSADSAKRAAAPRAVSNPVEINVEPGIASRAARVKKYLPGCELQAVRKSSPAGESMDEVLKVPEGPDVDVASLRGAWTGATNPTDSSVNWHNPKLTALLPPLKVKIAAAQDAEDFARMILGVFQGRDNFATWAFKAEHRENGWLVTPSYIGPPASVRAQGPIELIMVDGVLQDIRQLSGMKMETPMPKPGPATAEAPKSGSADSTSPANSSHATAAPSAEAIERAKQTFREGSKSPNRAGAAKILYPLIKLGMTRSDVMLLLGVPDGAKAGQLVRFMDYSIGKDQEIEIEFDGNMEKVIRKHEVGLGLDPPPAAPPPIAANLRPFVKDYAAADTTLRAGFTPYKPELVWGEPLELTLMVENLGPKDFEFMFGGDYRGTGRHDRIKIDVTDAAGKLLPDPHAGAFDFGGMMSREILTPGGQIFKRTLDLNQFRTIEKPGDYTVTCSFAFDEPHTTKKGPAKPVVKSSFRLTILDRTPERVAKVLDELVAKAQAAPDSDLGSVLALIARFGQDDAVPRLVRLAEKGSLPRRAAVYAALPLARTDSSLDAALAGLKDASPVIRAAAAGALGAIEKPRGVEALLAALPNEKSPVSEAILVALGTSKSERAMPVLASALAQGSSEMKVAAVAALVAYGGPQAISTLNEHTGSSDLLFRYQVVLALAEKLRQPMQAEWLLPILMRRKIGHEWLDSLRLMRLYAGERAIPALLSCLDFDAAWNYRNWWILNEVKACPKAPAIDYAYDPNSNGTPEQWEKNRRLLQSLKPLAGPIPAVAAPRANERVPYLKTDPPIDFKPRLKPVTGAAEIQSGFLKLTINRNGYTIPYSPSDAYRPIYQVASDVRALLGRPDLFERLGVTPQQAEQLRKLPPPPDRPVDTGWNQLYIAYKDAPAGPFQEQAADDLGEAVRAASQDFHAAQVAFAEGARKILTATQLERLPEALKEKPTTSPSAAPARDTEVRPKVDTPSDVRQRLTQSLATLQTVYEATREPGQIKRRHLWLVGEALPWRSTLQPSCLRWRDYQLKQTPEPWPTVANAPSLRSLLTDQVPGIRALAAEALATLHEPEDLQRLSALLTDRAEATMELAAPMVGQQRQADFIAIGPEADAVTRYTWHKTTVANHAAWGLYLMLGECCPNAIAKLQFGPFGSEQSAQLPQVDPSILAPLLAGDPKDHLWYWQEHIHRAMHELDDAAEGVLRASTPGFDKLDYGRQIRMIADERLRARKEWMKSFIADMRTWPAERRAMVRLLASNVHQGGADMAYYDTPDALLFSGPLELGLEKSRILELLDGIRLWPDERTDRGGPSQVVERLALGWRECFDAADVPRLLARFSSAKDDLWWSARAAIMVALANLMPTTGTASDDPATAEGFLRRTLKEDHDVFVRVRAAFELMRIGSDVHWPFLMDRFFADRENGDYLPSHILQWFATKAPAGDDSTKKLIELVSDARYRPLWLEAERPMGKGIQGGVCRRMASQAINARAGRTVVNSEDLIGLKDPEQGPERLRLVLARVREIGKP